MAVARKKLKEASIVSEDGLDEQTRKALVDRLARLEGHVRAVRRMLLEKRDADEVLLQTAAVKAALNRFAGVLLENEIRVCAEQPSGATTDERLDKVTRVLGTLLKQS